MSIATGTRKVIRRKQLQTMLLARLRELQGEVRSRVGNMRAAPPTETLGSGEDADVDVQQDIDLAMIQMRAETSRQIQAALVRIDIGEYGDCSSCGDEIPQGRLQALPFAVRCTACEEAREVGDARRERLTRQSTGAPLLPNATRY